MAGRPRILCEQKQGEICKLLAAGATLEDTASYVGCSVNTIRREAQRNPQFREKLEKSRSERDLWPVRTVHDAATHDWRAAAWFLERTQPERFSKRPPNTFTVEDVAKLLDRVCEAARDEFRDPQTFARVERRVASIVQEVLGKRASRRMKLSPLRTQTIVEAAALPIAIPQPAPILDAEMTTIDQNVTKCDPVLICVADFLLDKPKHLSQTAVTD
jgi:hypothetical protein